MTLSFLENGIGELDVKTGRSDLVFLFGVSGRVNELLLFCVGGGGGGGRNGW